MPTEPIKPYNVSCVPQLSPFRYPGGKTWFVPYVRLWLQSIKSKPQLLIEPFAGGAIVGLTAAAENLVERVILVEKDERVAAVWKTILNGSGAWLANRIVDFEFTPEAVKAELTKATETRQERAFQTLLRNRVSRGGLLAPGSGLLNKGEGEKGLGSRWYPLTLQRRILQIVEAKDRIECRKTDGVSVIRQHANQDDVAFFIDPPYTAAARNRFYTHAEIDHASLFKLVSRLKGPFLLMYDSSEKVLELAEKHKLQIRFILMKNTHNLEMQELLIGRDLSWIDNKETHGRREQELPLSTTREKL